MKKSFTGLFSVLIMIVVFSVGVYSQTTEFTYQGKLNDGSIAATGDYNFEFRLFSVNTGGTVISTIQRLGVPVSSGVFTVKLDFGANFDGQPRWLEIAIKPAGDPGGFQQLLPRQPVTSAPYSVRSLNASTADTATNATNATNANQLGGIAAGQYVLTGDARLSDARDPLPGSASYIQNRPIQQASTNFNISGDGTAGGTLSGNVLFGNVVNTATQFNIGGSRVLSTGGTNNVFVGPGTGTNNNTGTGNSFFGQDAGNVNAAGSQNTFVGRWAGFSNTGADSNTFVGFGAGKSTTAGSNAFFGANAGNANTTGSSNTIIGANADVNSGNLTHATAIGAGALAVNSNEITLGRASGSDRVVIAGPLNINGQVTASDVNLIGFLFLGSLAPAGSEHLCRNNNALVATCSSSLRYKTNLAPYSSGLNILNRLRPITSRHQVSACRDADHRHRASA